jgi:phosphatidylinositol alpha-1,6-mannosyltransferase
VCHPGIEHDPSAPEPDARLATDRPASVLIVGRMSSSERYKGHDALLDIWPDVVREMPDARLEIVGQGDDRARLEAKAAQLGIARRASFVGQVDDRELTRRYEACSVFVMPSGNEGFGFVFLEAMRAARPCIGASGAASEIIAHERTGLLVDPGDRTQLYQAVLRLLRDRPEAERMGACGRRRFLEAFTEARFRARFATAIGAEAAAVPA